MTGLIGQNGNTGRDGNTGVFGCSHMPFHPQLLGIIASIYDRLDVNAHLTIYEVVGLQGAAGFNGTTGANGSMGYTGAIKCCSMSRTFGLMHL